MAEKNKLKTELLLDLEKNILKVLQEENGYGIIFFDLSCLGGGMVYARVSKTRGCNDLESSSLSLGTSNYLIQETPNASYLPHRT